MMIRTFAISTVLILTAPESATAQVAATQSHEIRQAVRELVIEAHQHLHAGEGLPAAAEPDFAERFEHEPPVEALQDALITQQHRNKFVDAYVRWQLLSFDPPFPELDDRQFQQLIQNLPELTPNPSAERAFLNMAERADNADWLDQADYAYVQDADDQRQALMIIAESLNRPAMQLRHWVRMGVEDSHVRTLQVLLEEVEAKINGAWPLRGVEPELDAELTRAADELSPSEKQFITDQLRQTMGTQQRIVESITFRPGEQTVDVEFKTIEVTREDYQRWTDTLADDERD